MEESSDYEDPFLGGKVLGNLFDVAAWKNKVSDIVVDDIFEAPIPGQDYSPVPGIPDKANYRKYQLERRYDLANYYRYNFKMLKTRQRVIENLMKAIQNAWYGFGKYGKLAKFQCKFDTGKTVTISYETLQECDRVVKKVLSSYVYMLEAWRMRNPYKGIVQGPISFAGMHKPYFATDVTIEWLNKEPKLKNLRKYFSEHLEYDWKDSHFFGGEVTPYAIRLVIYESMTQYQYSKKEKALAKRKRERLPVLYLWSDTMKEIFQPLKDTLPFTKVLKLTYQLIDKNVVLEGLNPPFDPENEIHGQFLEEMLVLRDYADLRNQEKVNAVERQKPKRRTIISRKSKYRYVYK